MTDVEIMIKAETRLDPKTFDSRNKKLENDSRLLPKKNWRFEPSIKK